MEKSEHVILKFLEIIFLNGETLYGWCWWSIEQTQRRSLPIQKDNEARSCEGLKTIERLGCHISRTELLNIVAEK